MTTPLGGRAGAWSGGCTFRTHKHFQPRQERQASTIELGASRNRLVTPFGLRLWLAAYLITRPKARNAKMPAKSTDQVVFCGTTVHFSNATKCRKSWAQAGRRMGRIRMAGADFWPNGQIVNKRNLQFKRVRFACPPPPSFHRRGLGSYPQLNIYLHCPGRVGCGATKKL